VGTVQEIAAKPSLAGVHGVNQHERSRTGKRREGAGADDVAILERLPQRLERVPLEFRQLVEKQHTG